MTTALKYGTYLRERDGATLLYHSDSALWNDPHSALEAWRNGTPTFGSLGYWRIVNDAAELAAVRALAGSELMPGEYIETPGSPANPAG